MQILWGHYDVNASLRLSPRPHSHPSTARHSRVNGSATMRQSLVIRHQSSDRRNSPLKHWRTDVTKPSRDHNVNNPDYIQLPFAQKPALEHETWNCWVARLRINQDTMQLFTWCGTRDRSAHRAMYSTPIRAQTTKTWNLIINTLLQTRLHCIKWREWLYEMLKINAAWTQ